MDYMNTPYAKDILELLNADAPIKYVTIFKGQSIGMSSGVIEPAIGYFLNPPVGRLTAVNNITYSVSSFKDRHPVTLEQLDDE